MLLIDSVNTPIPTDVLLKRWLFDFIDPIALTAIVALASCRVIFKPMNTKQAELEWRHGEPCCIQNTTVGRALWMKELAEEITALHAIRFPSKKPTTYNSRSVLWNNRSRRQSNPPPTAKR